MFAVDLTDDAPVVHRTISRRFGRACGRIQSVKAFTSEPLRPAAPKAVRGLFPLKRSREEEADDEEVEEGWDPLDCWPEVNVLVTPIWAPSVVCYDVTRKGKSSLSIVK